MIPHFKFYLQPSFILIPCFSSGLLRELYPPEKDNQWNYKNANYEPMVDLQLNLLILTGSLRTELIFYWAFIFSRCRPVNFKKPINIRYRNISPLTFKDRET